MEKNAGSGSTSANFSPSVVGRQQLIYKMFSKRKCSITTLFRKVEGISKTPGERTEG